MSVRACFVANPASGRAALRASVRAVAEAAGAHWWESETADELPALGRRARAEGCLRIVAVGGDGTLRGLLAGLPPGTPCSVGLVPLGTGNDLARSLGLPMDPVEAAHLALSGADVPLDLIAAHTDGAAHVGANMAVGGWAGTLHEHLHPERKEQLGPFAYVGQALLGLPWLQAHDVRVESDGGIVDERTAIAVVVANGETAGGGIRAAPGADPGDGRLDLFVLPAGGPLELAGLAALLTTGDLRRRRDVLHRSVTEVRITADPPMTFNLDGDPLGTTPLTFRCLPSALRVVRGPAPTIQRPSGAR